MKLDLHVCSVHFCCCWIKVVDGSLWRRKEFNFRIHFYVHFCVQGLNFRRTFKFSGLNFLGLNIEVQSWSPVKAFEWEVKPNTVTEVQNSERVQTLQVYSKILVRNTDIRKPCSFMNFIKRNEKTNFHPAKAFRALFFRFILDKQLISCCSICEQERKATLKCIEKESQNSIQWIVQQFRWQFDVRYQFVWMLVQNGLNGLNGLNALFESIPDLVLEEGGLFIFLFSHSLCLLNQ